MKAAIGVAKMKQTVIKNAVTLCHFQTQSTHDVVSTPIRRLYDFATSYRRLIEVETTSCVYWETPFIQKLI